VKDAVSSGNPFPKHVQESKNKKREYQKSLLDNILEKGLRNQEMRQRRLAQFQEIETRMAVQMKEAHFGNV